MLSCQTMFAKFSPQHQCQDVAGNHRGGRLSAPEGNSRKSSSVLGRICCVSWSKGVVLVADFRAMGRRQWGTGRPTTCHHQHAQLWFHAGGLRYTKESPTHYMSRIFGNGINPAIGRNVGSHKQFQRLLRIESTKAPRNQAGDLAHHQWWWEEKC